MTKRLLIALAMIALAATACSKSDSSTKETSNTTQVAKSSSDVKDDETETTEGLKPRINLGGLSSGSDEPFSESEIDCMEEAISADPTFADMEDYEDIVTQADRELFWGYVLECTGSAPLVALFMEGFAESAGSDVTSTQLACVEDLVNALSSDEGVALLAGDPEVADALTTDVAELCLT